MTVEGSFSFLVHVHKKLERVIETRYVFRLKSIDRSFSIRFSPRSIVNGTLISTFLANSSKDTKDSLHSTSVEAVLDLEEVSEHLNEEVGLVFIGTDQLRTGVTLNEPQVQFFIKHEVQTVHLVDVTLVPESVGGHSNSVDESLIETWLKGIVNPVLVINFTGFVKVVSETFESPHLIVSEL